MAKNSDFVRLKIVFAALYLGLDLYMAKEKSCFDVGWKGKMTR